MTGVLTRRFNCKNCVKGSCRYALYLPLAVAVISCAVLFAVRNGSMFTDISFAKPYIEVSMLVVCAVSLFVLILMLCIIRDLFFVNRVDEWRILEYTEAEDATNLS